MNNEEAYFQRLEALETDIVLLKLAIKELDRQITELKRAQ